MTPEQLAELSEHAVAAGFAGDVWFYVNYLEARVVQLAGLLEFERQKGHNP